MARCDDCEQAPTLCCGRCAARLCSRHAPGPWRRCAACEAEWDDDGQTRRALQHMFAPPTFVLAGGITFGLLLPLLLALPFTAAATLVAAAATAVGFTAAAGTCQLVERAARAQFLRESARALPTAIVRRLGHASAAAAERRRGEATRRLAPGDS